MRKKKRTNLPLLILCLLLAVALVVSLISLRNAKKDVQLLEAQLQELAYENESLSNLNQALRLQLDSYFLSPSGSSSYVEEDYCALMVADWSEKDGVLSFDAQAEVFLTAPAAITSRLELWRGDAVYDTQNITLSKADSDTAYQTAFSTSFEIPKITQEEELQLWLMVELENGETLFACAASWRLEGDDLVIITG